MEHFHLNYDALGALTVVCGLWYLWVKGKLPSAKEFREYTDTLDTRGGNILILFVFSVILCLWTLRLEYTLIWMQVGQKLTAENAFAMTGLNFMTGLTGTVIGALLKTMTGAAPNVAGTSTTSTVSSTTSTPETH